NKKSWYSSIGKASITVYAGSTFLAPHGYIILNKFLNFSRDVRVNFIAMMIYCVVLVWVCSLPIFGEIFDGLCGLLNKSLFSEKNGEE
ncbi:MAG: hypothetical protein Q4E53_12735, partial [Eubacteriales bacterium]|nr:hypothetical protein [Eubacteriales bacterium]